MSTPIAGEYNSTPPTLGSGQKINVQTDPEGRLLVVATVNGSAAGPSNPEAVFTQPVEVLVTPVVSSAIYSSGVAMGGAIPLSGGFIVGASAGSLRHLSVDLAVSTAANITATILRGAVSTASTVGDHSTASIVAADTGKVISTIVMAPGYPPGPSSAVGTVYCITGIDMVVPSGGFVVLTPSASITLPSTSAVTVGAGIA